MASFKVLGSSDSVTVCDCCGKKNLKMTVQMERDEAEVVHYGRDCAGAALMGGSKNAKKAGHAERLARSVQFAGQKLADGVPADEIRRRLTVAGWANMEVRNGTCLVWNDAGSATFRC